MCGYQKPLQWVYFCSIFLSIVPSHFPLGDILTYHLDICIHILRFCKNMYPSIKFSTIKKAVRFFARKLTTAIKKTINLFLELIRIGMSCTLIYFDGDYYKYHGGQKEEQGLAIGGYESSFLTDLVAYYLFERTNALLNQKIYCGIYRYDGLVALKGNKSVKEIKYWLEDFQKIFNRATNNQHPQFTA